MGKMLRRYWIPALLAEELRAGGRPKRVRLLGENLIAFRDLDGHVGLLDEFCPHRGASLALAATEDCAVRCPYHGWKIDASGAVLDTPAEPENSSFKDKVRTRAYAVRDFAGLIWAYLGPAGTEPPMMDFAWTAFPQSHRWIGKMREECNWAQCMDGILDSVHINYLHADTLSTADLAVAVMDEKGLVVLASCDGRPKIEVENTSYGFRYGTIRRPMIDPDKNQHVRVTQFIAPIFTLIPPPAGLIMMQIFVPIDDESTMLYYVKASLDGPMDDAERTLHETRSGMRPGIDMDVNYRKFRSRENDWLQSDDEAPFSARVPSVAMQDMVVQESMGPIFDRSREHLATSDVAVIRFRRLLLDSARRFAERGEPPLGLSEAIHYDEIHAEDRVLPLSTPWQTVGANGGGT
jgi:phthalate 4,5-dioxygenase oxygenase subunit